MKVAVLLNRLSEGGAERVGTAWADGLRNRGHTVDIIATHQNVPSVAHEYIPLTARLFPHRIWKLGRVLRTNDYEVVLSLMPHWNVLSLLTTLTSARKVKTVISLHSLEAGMSRTHGLSFRVETLLARFLYPRADAVVAVSHAVGAESKVKYRLQRRKLWIVPNPVLDMVTKYSFPKGTVDDSLCLVFSGRLVEQKNPIILLQCAARLMEKRNDRTVRVEYFGAGALEKTLQQEADRLDVQTTFHGWCDDWTSACPRDAVLVLPSEVEGFGNVLVEAAAVGIPSVASSRALGVADAILPGVTGALAVGDGISDFCEAIEEAESLPQFDASAWMERFTSERAASILDRILKSLGSKTDMN